MDYSRLAQAAYRPYFDSIQVSTPLVQSVCGSHGGDPPDDGPPSNGHDSSSNDDDGIDKTAIVTVVTAAVERPKEILLVTSCL